MLKTDHKHIIQLSRSRSMRKKKKNEQNREIGGAGTGDTHLLHRVAGRDPLRKGCLGKDDAKRAERLSRGTI